MKLPLSPERWALLPQDRNKNFNAASTVVIPLQPGECPETRADDLRRWCGANCVGRWKPLERWTKRSVGITFEAVTDAAMFRLAN